MKNSKTIQVIQTFDKRDWKQFRRYLLTEVEEASEVMILFDKVASYRKNWDHKKLDADHINKTLFPSKTKANFTNLLSRIHLYSLDYIAIESLKKDQSALILRQMKGLKERRLYPLAQKRLTALEKENEQKPLDIWDNLTLMQAYHYLKFSDFTLTKEEIYNLHKLLSQSWQSTKQDLDAYYLMDATIDERVFHFPITDYIQSLNHSLQLYDHPNLIKDICINLINLHQNRDISAANFLKNLIRNKSDELNSNLSIPILQLLIEYEVVEIKKGKEDQTELYELDKLGYEKDLLIQNGVIGVMNFYTSAQTICYVKGYDEAFEWVNTMRRLLPPSFEKQTVALSQAAIAIIDDKADLAIDLLYSVDFETNRFNRIAKLNLLKAYFIKYGHLKDGFIDMQIENFKKYLRRHKSRMSEQYFESYWNFVKMLELMIEGANFLKVKEEMEKLEKLTSRPWITNYYKKRNMID